MKKTRKDSVDGRRYPYQIEKTVNDMKYTILISALLGALTAVAQQPAHTIALTGDELQRLHQRTDAYLDSVQHHPDWLLPRLQMYWKSHATDVYVNGETFSHAGGDRAPVPTVKFNGTRSHGTAYDRPSLADVVPYDDDDNSSVTFINKTTRVQEKTHPSKTGCNIASLNQQILRIARDAARLYAHYGFDSKTHIWCESPGYSVNVVKDYVTFANTIDQQTGIDLFAQLPVIEQAVFALPQYLFPNRMICGFGDTHPNYLSLQTIDIFMEYARRRGKDDLLARLEQLRAAILPDAPAQVLAPYVSPTFYSPNVSILVQRTGMETRRDLMISVNGALGNHQHANGINIELYGRGYVVGPDAGIGKMLYSGADYQKYYSRFPAHNTVCVDGVSDHMWAKILLRFLSHNREFPPTTIGGYRENP